MIGTKKSVRMSDGCEHARQRSPSAGHDEGMVDTRIAAAMVTGRVPVFAGTG
jgi:hypothetical protein